MIRLDKSYHREFLDKCLEVQKIELVIYVLSEGFDRYDSKYKDSLGRSFLRSFLESDRIGRMGIYGVLIGLFIISFILWNSMVGVLIYVYYQELLIPLLLSKNSPSYIESAEYLLISILILTPFLTGMTMLWYYPVFLINKGIKMAQTVTFPDELMKIEMEVSAKRYLQEIEMDELKQLENEWEEIYPDWNKESYNVKRGEWDSKGRLSDVCTYMQLYECGAMYDELRSGRCSSIDGKQGAFERTKWIRKKGLDPVDIDNYQIHSKAMIEEHYPFLKETRTAVNETIYNILESNEAVLKEYLRYNYAVNEAGIKALFEKTECYRFIQECRKKKKELSEWKRLVENEVGL